MSNRPEKIVVFELAYEIIHKLGGIETVIRTKAAAQCELYGDNFYEVGPYTAHDPLFGQYFERFTQNEENKEIINLIHDFSRDYDIPLFDPTLPENMSNLGIAKNSANAYCIHYGQWLINGHPQVLLMPLCYDGNGRLGRIINAAKDALQRHLCIEIPYPHGEFEPFKFNALVFGVTSWLFISYAMNKIFNRNNMGNCGVLVHSHEWLSAFALILFKNWGNYEAFTHVCPNDQLNLSMMKSRYLEYTDRNLKFIWTTHATIMGRYLATSDPNFSLSECLKRAVSDEKDWANGRKAWIIGESRRMGIEVEYQTEYEAARVTDVLTSVSDVTGEECKVFYNRWQDVVTYNGMDIDAAQGFVDDHELQSTHKVMRDRLFDFVTAHFYGTQFDKDNTLFFISAGRCEVRNKGFDMYIQALGELNRLMKQERENRKDDPNDPIHKKTVVGILVAPAPNDGYNKDTLFGINTVKAIKNTTTQLSVHIAEKLADMIVEPSSNSVYETIPLTNLLEPHEITLLKQYHTKLSRRNGLPPVVTHNIDENVEQCREILNLIRQQRLFNNYDDPVKFIWHPEFLAQTLPIGMSYQDAIRGCHLGVFLSLYEPWGLTSPECEAIGVPSITTNVSGFGMYVEKLEGKHMKQSPSAVSFISSTSNVFATPTVPISSFGGTFDHQVGECLGDYDDNRKIEEDAEECMVKDSGFKRSSSISSMSNPPVESPSISKNFKWMESKFGVAVVDRKFKPYHECVEELARDYLLGFVKLDRKQRIALRNRTSRNSTITDWGTMIDHYRHAHDLALSKIKKF